MGSTLPKYVHRCSLCHPVIHQKCVEGISALPKEEAERMTNWTVHYPGDEEHYITTLDVFHQLVSTSKSMVTRVGFPF